MSKPGFVPHQIREQRFELLDVLFRELDPGETLSLAPGDVEINADRVFLRAVLTGGGRLRWGDMVLELPLQAKRAGEAELRMVEVPPLALREGVELEAGPQGAIVLSAGWVYENGAKP